MKWKPLSTAPLMDVKRHWGKKECSKNQAESELNGSICLYTNLLEAERSKTNQMEATFHDTITGVQKTLEKNGVLVESSRKRTLWLDTFIYESVESRKKQNESNGSHFHDTINGR
jgi:hypothetical protein